MRRVAGPLAILATVVLVSACSAGGGSTASGSPTTVPTRLLAGQPMASCVIHGDVPVTADVDGLCGSFEVPEDRSHPDGRRISLRVAVVPAAAAVPAPDAFVAIAGGPGDASTSFFAWLPGLYSGVHATHDIVLVDQRGTGESNAMTLPPLPDTTGLPATEADARLTAWARDGLAALDGDPRLYTSTVAADDLDEVRAALGYDQLDLYGTSYGGTLAQYYLRQHPEHVRVAVLDGASPLDVPVLEAMAANSQGAIELLLSRCEADAACHAAFPDLDAEWSALVDALRTGITVTDPASGAQVTADLTTVGPSVHLALLTGDAAARLPLAIHLAAEGRWDRATELVPPPASGGTTLAMKDVILCSEAWARFDPVEVARTGVGSYYEPYAVGWAESLAAMCRALPTGVVAADDGAPVATSIPILWLTGDGDPQDGPTNLTAVPAQEPASRILVMPAQEHVVGHLGCGPAVIAAFVDAGTADGLDSACLTRGADPSPSFALP